MALPHAITRLAPEDLDACLELAADREWRPERRKWALLFEVGEVFGIRDPAGGLAGSVTLTRYGPDLAIVSMMLVASRFDGRGLGRRLMTHVLAQAGDATVFLYATPLGRALYAKVGFRALGSVTTSVGRFAAGPTGGTRAAAERDRDAILALDAGAIGADRADVLSRYFTLAEQLRVIERDGAVRGFAAAAANVDNVVVGPLVAPDLDAARTLIADVASAIDAPVRLDLDHRHDGLLEWARERGVMPRNDTWLMVHGERELPGARDRLILPVMQALG
ncbi:MAG TPA: GNAT family N-acetyltransferase [Solirubrobacteraceae bacterium]|nr:GNAT family N-acetyltransferase [Solirubrobacteraceae bacterium]